MDLRGQSETTRPSFARSQQPNRGQRTADTDRARAPKLSVVIPAYNEDERLLRHLRRLFPVLQDALGDRFEVIVVDDGSEPPIRQLLAASPFAERVHVLRHEKNLGKGASLRDGFLHAAGECVVFADADGATPPEDLLRLAAAVYRGAAVALGCRVRGQALGWVQRDRRRRLASRLFALAARWVVGLPVVDPQIGFKALHRRRLQPVVEGAAETGYLFDLELLLKARRMKLPLQALAVHWTECPGSRLRLLRDGIGMITGLLRLRERLALGSRRIGSHRPTGLRTKHNPPLDLLPRRAPLSTSDPSYPTAPHNGVYENRFLYRWIFEPTHRKVARCLGEQAAGRILDVGAGSAGLGRLLCHRNPRIRYIAVDPVPRGKHPCPRIKAVAEALPFAAESFDVVLCTHAAHHFRSIEQACREISRVLKPGGRAVIVDGSIDSPAGYIVHRLLITRIEGGVVFATSKQWRAVLLRHGLDPDSTMEFNLPMPVILFSACKRLSNGPAGAVPAWPLRMPPRRKRCHETVVHLIDAQPGRARSGRHPRCGIGRSRQPVDSSNLLLER